MLNCQKSEVGAHGLNWSSRLTRFPMCCSQMTPDLCLSCCSLSTGGADSSCSPSCRNDPLSSQEYWPSLARPGQTHTQTCRLTPRPSEPERGRCGRWSHLSYPGNVGSLWEHTTLLVESEAQFPRLIVSTRCLFRRSASVSCFASGQGLHLL